MKAFLSHYTYTPRRITMRDAKQIAHHAIVKINRWLKENADV